MLSLVRSNAAKNIDNPEFQQDMLEAIDDAVIRMNKVQSRLNMLNDEIIPALTDLDLCAHLDAQCSAISHKLGDMPIELRCASPIHLKTDPGFLSQILENILLNARESGANPPRATVEAKVETANRQVVISISDNGSGISEELLPYDLFMPLKSTKPGGSGIGLWQVKQLVSSLCGTIAAENSKGGAKFTIRFPLSSPHPPAQQE